jgi:outer membrane biosynthesis protein TonB
MKKLLLFLLCVSVILLIPSCGGKNDGAALPSAEPKATAAPVSESAPEPTPEPTPDAAPEPTPHPTPEPTPAPTPRPSPEPTPEPASEPTPGPTPGPMEDGPDADPSPGESEARDYVLNKNTMKFHVPSCKSASQIKEKNREDYTGTREEIIDMGYEPCKNCNP